MAVHHKLGESDRLELVNGRGARWMWIVDHGEVDSLGVVLRIREGRRIAMKRISRKILWTLNMALTSFLRNILSTILECPEHPIISIRIERG
jgi:hypothetical protein